MVYPLSSSFALIALLTLFLGCNSLRDINLLKEEDKFEALRTYENDFGSRIELLLNLAKTELIENFEKKKYLMIREQNARAVLHPRMDVSLRQLIHSAHKDENITDKQMLKYQKNCDELFELWEEHWRYADRKARSLGFDR